jgi:hypothetical protein
MLTVAQMLAENNFGDTRSGGLAGPMGLFLLILLAIATVLLIRNMNTRLRRLPDRFPHQEATDRFPHQEATERAAQPPVGGRGAVVQGRTADDGGAGREESRADGR